MDTTTETRDVRRSSELPAGAIPRIDSFGEGKGMVTHAALVIARRHGILSQSGITLCGKSTDELAGWARGFGPPAGVTCPDCKAAMLERLAP